MEVGLARGHWFQEEVCLPLRPEKLASFDLPLEEEVTFNLPLEEGATFGLVPEEVVGLVPELAELSSVVAVLLTAVAGPTALAGLTAVEGSFSEVTGKLTNPGSLTADLKNAKIC